MFIALLLVFLSLALKSNGDIVIEDNNRRIDMNYLRFRNFVPRYLQNMISNDSNRNSNREERGFQFHVHNDDLIVHLEFTVPLVEIPVHRSIAFARTALSNLVNLNLSSLFFSVVILAIGGVIFALFRTLSIPVVYTTDIHHVGKKQMRLYDALLSDEIIKEFLVDPLESKFQSHNIDATACLQHTVCHYFAKRADGFFTSHYWHKILDGLVNLHELQPIVSGSPLQQAIAASRNGSCTPLPTSNCARFLGAASGLVKRISKYIAINLSDINK